MTTEVISPDLKVVLRRLKLSRMLDTLPERLELARQQKMPHQDWRLLVLSDEATRRDSLAVSLREQKGHLDPTMHLEAWDPTAKVTFDRALLNELVSLRFLDAHAHVAIVGPVGVGKTFLAHALGHIACRRGASAEHHRSLFEQRLRSSDRRRILSATPETQPAPAGPRTRKAALERKAVHVTGRRKQLASFLGRPDAKFFVEKGDEQKNAKKA